MIPYIQFVTGISKTDDRHPEARTHDDDASESASPSGLEAPCRARGRPVLHTCDHDQKFHRRPGGSGAVIEDDAAPVLALVDQDTADLSAVKLQSKLEFCTIATEGDNTISIAPPQRS